MRGLGIGRTVAMVLGTTLVVGPPLVGCGSSYGETEPPSSSAVNTSDSGAKEGGSGGSADAVAPGCTDEGARSLNGHCYFIAGSNVGFQEASEACTAAGGHLVTVTSDDEFGVVKAIAAAKGADVWIGLRADSPTTNKSLFHWITGEAVTVSFWASDQPTGDNGEACVALANAAEWADRDCTSDRYPALCERE